MSLNKVIKYSKEHRKPYRGGKTVSAGCRNHGGCEWCLGNRLHKFNKPIYEEEMDENLARINKFNRTNRRKK